MAKILDKLLPGNAQHALKLRQGYDWTKAEYNEIADKYEAKKQKELDRFVIAANKKLAKVAFDACDKQEYADSLMADKLQRYDVKNYLAHRGSNHKAAKAIFKAIKTGTDYGVALDTLKTENAAILSKREAYVAKLQLQRDSFVAKHTTSDHGAYDTLAKDLEKQYKEFSDNLDKRYAELYRIHVIPDDEAYALTNNYELHETYSGTSTGASSTITGQRTDVTYDNIGSQNASNVNKVTGYNSSAENTNDSSDSETGSREDTHQFTKGQEQDTARSQGTDGHTLRRWGNIGVMTIEDILQKHANLWESFSFYKIVFDDICKNFLLIGRM